MMRKHYAKLGRLTYKAINPVMKRYFTSKHRRVRVVVHNSKGEILLVRSWLGHQHWSLPGGGIRANETPEQAVVRELWEETGLLVGTKNLRHLGDFINPYKEASFTILCYAVKIKKQTPEQTGRRKLEVLESAWFSRKNLPKGCSPTVGLALGLKG